MKTFLAVLGVIFLIYLAFKHFPLFVGIVTLIVAGIILAFILLGLFIVALPLLLVGLVAALIGWVIKKLRGESI